MATGMTREQYATLLKERQHFDWSLIENQDRYIVRLRAALIALGKTSEEVDRIVRDGDR